MNDMTELPFQTYERIFRRPWPGGRSTEIVSLLRRYEIRHPPGTAAANLSLQERLICDVRALGTNEQS